MSRCPTVPAIVVGGEEQLLAVQLALLLPPDCVLQCEMQAVIAVRPGL